MRKPAHPGLYEVTEDSPITLNGTRCRQCGTAFFPPLHIGCEVCGAPDEELTDEPLAARGAVHASATVHFHRGRGIEAPFTVAEVLLDAGPVVRGLVIGDELPVGQRVEAKWVVTRQDDDGNDLVEPRFEAVP
jgi:hypothetical protein